MVTKGYGFTVDDIDWSCPADLEPYAKAYELQNKIEDKKMWGYFGDYLLSAVYVAVERNIHGKKSKSKYMEKPIYEMLEEERFAKNNDRPEYKGLTQDQKQQAELKKAINYFNSLKARF